MARRLILENLNCPYHVSSRSNNREAFPLPLPKVWRIFEDYLYLVKIGFNLKIHAFVLMDNHFHLIVSAPNGNLSQALGYLIREVSREIGRVSKSRNHQFGGRSFKCAITNDHYFMHAYKYIYRNPVSAGICERVENYEFSTLRGLLGKSRLVIPVEEDVVLFDDIDQTLNWLNSTPEILQIEAVRLALRRQEFKLPRNDSGFASTLQNKVL